MEPLHRLVARVRNLNACTVEIDVTDVLLGDVESVASLIQKFEHFEHDGPWLDQMPAREARALAAALDYCPAEVAVGFYEFLSEQFHSLGILTTEPVAGYSWKPRQRHPNYEIDDLLSPETLERVREHIGLEEDPNPCREYTFDIDGSPVTVELIGDQWVRCSQPCPPHC